MLKYCLFLFFFILVFLPGCLNKINSVKEFYTLQQEVKARVNADLIWDNANFIDFNKKNYIDQVLSKGITRDDAITVALINNRRIQFILENLGIAKADLVQASLFSNPKLLAVWFFNQSDFKQVLMDANFECRWLYEISNFWQLPFNKQVNKMTVCIAIFDIVKEVFRIIKRARNAYDNLLYSRIQFQNIKQIHKDTLNLQKQIESSEKLKNREANRDFAQLIVGDWKLKVIDFDARVKVAEAMLRKVMGIEICADINLILKSKLSDVLIVLPDLCCLQDIGLRYNPNLQITLYRIKRAEWNIKYEKSKSTGSLWAGFEFERDFDKAMTVGPSIYFDMPIHDQNQAQISKAYFLLSKEKKLLRRLELKINTKIFKLFTQLNATKSQIEVYKNSLLRAGKELIKLSIENKKTFSAIGISNLRTQVSIYSIKVDYIDLYFKALNLLSDLENVIGKRIDKR